MNARNATVFAKYKFITTPKYYTKYFTNYYTQYFTETYQDHLTMRDISDKHLHHMFRNIYQPKVCIR